MSRAIYSRWYRGHVCAGFCKSTLGTREFREMAFQKSRNFISEFWWDPWTKLSYIEMVVITQNKISSGIVINHVDRSFHVLIVTTGDISMILSFEIWSYMLLELLHCYPVGIYAESNHRNKLWMELKPHWFKNALARNGFPGTSLNSWWRHQMETFSALFSLCDMFALAFSVLERSGNFWKWPWRNKGILFWNWWDSLTVLSYIEMVYNNLK